MKPNSKYQNDIVWQVKRRRKNEKINLLTEKEEKTGDEWIKWSKWIQRETEITTIVVM